MNKSFISVVLFFIFLSANLFSKDLKNLNVILTQGNTQTQLMAMILSIKSLENKAKVNIVLCSDGGDLAIKSINSKKLEPLKASPKMLLQKIIKKGGKVELCPLYLPNSKYKESDLLEGIKIANPMKVSKRLLDKNSNILSY